MYSMRTDEAKTAFYGTPLIKIGQGTSERSYFEIAPGPVSKSALLAFAKLGRFGRRFWKAAKYGVASFRWAMGQD